MKATSLLVSFAFTAALAIAAPPAFADQADKDACADLEEGDDCTRGDGDPGVCVPDDSDPDVLTCDDDPPGGSGGNGGSGGDDSSGGSGAMACSAGGAGAAGGFGPLALGLGVAALAFARGRRARPRG